MIIISDCVKDNLDEGCIKVASTLSKRLVSKGAKLLAVNCQCKYADKSITGNKVYSNSEIYKFISDNEGEILYIPFASNTLGTAIRTLVLSRKSNRKVTVLFALRWKMSGLTKFFLRQSGCSVFTISQDSYKYFKQELDGIEVKNLKIGVDAQKFTPVDDETKKALREKYKLPLDKKIILHVGHLKHERNVDVFLQLKEDYHGVLVFSSVTEQDKELKSALQSKSNITIIEDYCPNIEEIYQLADYYVFPVVAESNSIDIPLSVLEAAGCNIKIISTRYKEISFFDDTVGLKKVDGNQLNNLNNLIEDMDKVSDIQTRNIAVEYDWQKALDTLYGA